MSALDVMISRHLSHGDHITTIPIKSLLDGHSLLVNRQCIMSGANVIKVILPTSRR